MSILWPAGITMLCVVGYWLTLIHQVNRQKIAITLLFLILVSLASWIYYMRNLYRPFADGGVSL